jgi:hypothetical protein
MAGLKLRSLFVALSVALAWAFLSAPTVSSCPFCQEERGPTLLADFKTAEMVLLGTFTNAKPGGGLEDGTSDFVIERVFKSHDFIAKKKVIEKVPRYMPSKSKFLIFCDVYKGVLDPWKGIEVQSNVEELVRYIDGALKVKDRPLGERLRYCFDFLNSGELDVAMDAYREFARADYKDYRDMARKLPAATLAGWLRDAKTPSYRYGLYASLLGHCGGPADAKLLRSMLDDPQQRLGSGVDGMLAGYLMLQPKEGWSYLNSLLKDERLDFLMRYAALRTVRFYWETRTDVYDKKDLVRAICLAMNQQDMSDFAIEDLRKWACWDVADQVIGLFGQKTHDVPIIRRAILRYALSCPTPNAKAFVAQQRKMNREWVEETWELLRLEQEAPPAVQPPAEKK